MLTNIKHNLPVSELDVFHTEDRTNGKVVSIALTGLPDMYCNESCGFVYTRRKLKNGQFQCAGNSLRYSAIVTLGSLHLPENVQKQLFAGESTHQFCSRLLAEIDGETNLGDVALIAWAAAELKHPNLEKVIMQLRKMSASHCQCPTVEAAWVLTALAVASDQISIQDELDDAMKRLQKCFNINASIFRHHTDQSKSQGGRSHVSCFADQVYPIQALAKYHIAINDNEALDTATACAQRICQLQGDAGQWWWHYDSRTGNVIEGYPVYSVHQDAMGPMALLDLQEAGGPCFDKAIERSLQWLINPPEINNSLIDEKHSVIWRKVARAEPKKATRFIRAVTTRAHKNFRMQWLDSVFRPTAIDYECRPYHLGWILYTWQRRREL